MKFVWPSYGFTVVKDADTNQHYIRVEINDLTPEEIEEGKKVGAILEDGKTALWHVAIDGGWRMLTGDYGKYEAAFAQLKKEQE